MSSVTDIQGMATGLQQSVDAAMKRLQDQAKSADPAPENVQEFEQDVRKKALNIPSLATDIGVLTKDVSRLNVMSQLGKNDPVDFYKVKVTTAGEVTLGRVGDEGVRFQLMDKSGTIIADSDPGQGKAYDAFQKMQGGTQPLDRGDYTVRISRDKSVPQTEQRNYAFQLRMGTYSKDYDTIARQPKEGDRPFDPPSYLAMLNGGSATGGTAAGNSLASILLAGSGGRGSLFNGLF
ncbi:hypothetical protein HL658_34615 [Azospirillum sp. RWY-5-1]|uniref:Basal-body rod modification protein FlgD n=1 Tax=Azospirillum oleiclasticum TaxID=2735135 RepID=A0ABX2TDU3_9PROT|nr:hypothetical protein [Azospirillum oleiclasticum]NYZ17706.1 hypothetical protein [Azospirillum oleiclasticum]NYZ21184.1 hypothetical protein [Azospirillum oleiclasticum]